MSWIPGTHRGHGYGYLVGVGGGGGIGLGYPHPYPYPPSGFAGEYVASYITQRYTYHEP
jgi:hypothetical protein